MNNYITYEKFIVKVPEDIFLICSYKKLLETVFNITRQYEAVFTLRNHQTLTISLSVYAQLSFNDYGAPYQLKEITGIIVKNKKQVQELVDELDKARMWALLKR
jgi:Holliday junction resolvasome RuvABC endonuclease subunit